MIIFKSNIEVMSRTELHYERVESCFQPIIIDPGWSQIGHHTAYQIDSLCCQIYRASQSLVGLLLRSSQKLVTDDHQVHFQSCQTLSNSIVQFTGDNTTFSLLCIEESLRQEFQVLLTFH